MTKRSHILRITRDLNHAPERVFAALTDPVKMARWFFAYPGGSAIVTNDLREGGTYRIEMIGGDERCIPQGRYLEIVPPSRLVFTWSTDKLVPETKVTIELLPRGTGTRLVLTHELPEDQIPPHEAGWNTCFEQLASYLSAQSTAH